MSNFIITENLRNEILNLYFKEKNTMKQISDKTKISRYTISKILHQDKRFESEKQNRKEEILKRPQKNRLIFYKNNNSYNVKVSIPYSYVKKLGFTLNDRITEISLDEKNERIILKKFKSNI